MLAVDLALVVITAQPGVLDVRFDPIVTLVAAGASAGVDAAPASFPLRLSVAAFHAEVPALLVPLITRGVPGVHVTEDAVQLAAFVDEVDRRGFYFGPELYLYALTYRAGSQRARASEAYAHVTGGYTWFPVDGVGFFLQPWATLGVPVFHSGGAALGVARVEDRVLNWHATVSVGWRFST